MVRLITTTVLTKERLLVLTLRYKVGLRWKENSVISTPSIKRPPSIKSPSF